MHNGFEHLASIAILIAEMSALECTHQGCTEGPGGGKYKTPALEPAVAIEMLKMHREDCHSQVVGPVGGSSKVQLTKIPRPTISGGCSQEDFQGFKRAWKRYTRASNETDEVKLKDQLVHCPDTDLSSALDKAIGDRVDNLTVEELMHEIEVLAVVRQSNNVNTLAMMTVKQERDEPVRQFAARVRGLAAVCDLSVLCSCGLKVSEVDKWVRMSLISGLHDEETKQAVLSKVEEMPLADTITFVEARETGKISMKILAGTNSSSHVNRVQGNKDDQGSCRYCGKKGHGKNPNADLRKTDCSAYGKKCMNCKLKGHFADLCNRKGDKKGDPPKDSTKTTAGANTVTINRLIMSEKSRSGRVSRVSQSTQNLIRKQQNMKKLRHEVWSARAQTYIKSSLPEEPSLKLRMCLDILPYKKHDPPLKCNVRKEWLESLGTNLVQKDILINTSTADTGAQCFLLGRNHLPGLGLGIEDLLPSEINLNCANSTTAGNLGVFFAKVRGEHYETQEVVEARSMVYVIEGDIVLVSRAVLETLGCIPKSFPRVGEFLKTGDKSLTGKAFAVNPNPTGWKSDGTFDDTIAGIPEDKDATKDKKKSRAALPNTGSPMGLAGGDVTGVNSAPQPASFQGRPGAKAVRQPKGECDPESELPCSCPRRAFVDPPEKLPMPATDSNRKALEEWIKDYYKAGAFNTCKRQHWPITAGPPMKIHTREDAPRIYCRRPTKVPLHFREEVKAGLESDVKKGVLERVPVGEKDTWCSRMVIQPKKNGRARRTVDLSGLSRVGRHESHHTRSAAEIVKSVPAGKLKSTLDCVDGYHGVELAKEDRHKTTFSTEWGLFRYLRVPQGYLSSGDSYTKHTDAILDACPGKTAEHDYEKIIDDIIQWSETLEQSFFRICSILSHCNENGMVFSPEKFAFARESVEFAGFEITLKGIRPTARYIESIRNFPTPTNISEVRSWFGLINQVAYSFVKTTHMMPFRHLLSESKPFEWDLTMETAFQKSKEIIIELIIEGVASFDTNLVTCLSPDFSKDGMGWILQQKTCSCPEIIPTCCKEGWRLVLCGGHFCNKAEQNYSSIEGEATAVARGLDDTKYYTMGCKQLYVATDHKSLVQVLGDQSLADVENPRLARIKERTLWWQFTLIHTPGKLQLAADALSRRKGAATYQVSVQENHDDDEESVMDDLKNRLESFFPDPDSLTGLGEGVDAGENSAPNSPSSQGESGERTAAANYIMNSDEVSVITWGRLREAAEEDPIMVKLMEVVMRGFPKSCYELEEDMKQFHKFRHDLHVAEGLVCYKDRAVIPAKLRQQVLETIHAAHQGVTGMLGRVEDTVFWPSITTDIIRTRGSCLTCVRDAPSQPAGSPVAPPVPSFPFQYVVGDYFSLAGTNYLVLGDRFSGWLSIYSAGRGEFDAKSLVNKSREYFTNFNIPEELATDGGPQMTSAVFQKNLKAWGIRHRLSASYNPHSNCRAELAVKAGKKLLRDNVGPGGSLDTDRVMRAVMQFRNTPMQDCRRSPAQMVFGRQMRDFIPSLQHKYEPAKDWSVTQEYRERTLALKRDSDNKRWSQKTRDLDTLEIGTPVAIQNQTGSNPTKWDKTGVILENKPHSQVLIRVDGSRRVTMRNRRFIRELNPDLRRIPVSAPVMKKSLKKTAEKTVAEPVPDVTAAPHEVQPVHSEEPEEVVGVHDRRDDQPLDELSQIEVPYDNHVDVVEEQELPVQLEMIVENPEPEVGSTRPRRIAKPNSKYSSDVYDLDYVGSKSRNKSRRSIRRAGI